ncbi:hypothetical protein AVEN_190499-1, partial [Araneus ventricosus]
VIGNSKANSYQALEIGTQTIKSLIGSNFGDIKQSKKNVVLPLASVSSAIQMNNETVVVDPLIIFQRTTITKKNDEDVADFLKYELSPFPLSPFNEGGMRKSRKSSLYDAFPEESSAIIDFKSSIKVVDGASCFTR